MVFRNCYPITTPTAKKSRYNIHVHVIHKIRIFVSFLYWRKMKLLCLSIISQAYFFDIQSKLNFVFGGVIPTFTVIARLVLTLTKLRVNREKRANNETCNRNIRRRDMEMTRQMIVVASLFSFLTILSSALHVNKSGINVQTPWEDIKVRVLDSLISILVAITNSANFYLYLLFGTKFRKNFIGLFKEEKLDNTKST